MNGFDVPKARFFNKRISTRINILQIHIIILHLTNFIFASITVEVCIDYQVFMHSAPKK